jgi:hypothetical protein
LRWRNFARKRADNKDKNNPLLWVYCSMRDG